MDKTRKRLRSRYVVERTFSAPLASLGDSSVVSCKSLRWYRIALIRIEITLIRWYQLVWLVEEYGGRDGREGCEYKVWYISKLKTSLEQGGYPNPFLWGCYPKKSTGKKFRVIREDGKPKVENDCQRQHENLWHSVLLNLELRVESLLNLSGKQRSPSLCLFWLSKATGLI